MYLHDLITYSSTKGIEMLSGLFPIQTNSLISCHEQSSVLLHQPTTFKELLSLIFYRKRAILCKVSYTFTFIHHITLTFEDADVPPDTAIWWSRAKLHKVTLTFTFMHQVILTFEDAYVNSPQFN